MKLGVDDQARIWLNEQPLGHHTGWRPARRIPGLVALLRPGRNVIAIEAENVATPVPANPAGLLVGFLLTSADGVTASFGSDAEWRVGDVAEEGWRDTGFDDSRWPVARVLAEAGATPWGQVSLGPPTALRPFAAGTADGKLRVTYLPLGEPIRLEALQPSGVYRADWIDPRSGREIPLSAPEVASDGSWATPPPPERARDWVLVVREAGASAGDR